MLSDCLFCPYCIYFLYLGKCFFIMPTSLKTFPRLQFAFSVLNSFIKTFNKLEAFLELSFIRFVFEYIKKMLLFIRYSVLNCIKT